MRNNKFIILIFFTCLSFNSLAQDSGDKSWNQKKQQFKTEKVAYISTEMNFTVEEAQKFWPVYNKYDELLDKIGEQRRQNFNPKCTDVNTLCEKKCADIIKRNFELDSTELSTRKAFYNELKTIFSDKQIMHYYHVEHEFRRRLISDKQKPSGTFGKSYKEN